MARPSKRPVKVCVWITQDAADWIETRRGPVNQGEYVRGLMRLGKQRIEAGVPLPRDREPAGADGSEPPTHRPAPKPEPKTPTKTKLRTSRRGGR